MIPVDRDRSDAGYARIGAHWNDRLSDFEHAQLLIKNAMSNARAIIGDAIAIRI